MIFANGVDLSAPIAGDSSAAVSVPFPATGWTLALSPDDPSTGSSSYSSGTVLATVASGGFHWYANSIHAWPLNYGAFQLRARIGFTTLDIAAQTGLRLIVEYPDGSYVGLEFLTNGNLNLIRNGVGTVGLGTGFTIGGSLGLRLDCDGLNVKVFYTINAGSDPTLDNWILLSSTTHPGRIPANLNCSVFREVHSSTECVCAIRDMSVTPISA